MGAVSGPSTKGGGPRAGALPGSWCAAYHAADAAAPNGYVSDVVFISKTGFETRS